VVRPRRPTWFKTSSSNFFDVLVNRPCDAKRHHRRSIRRQGRSACVLYVCLSGGRDLLPIATSSSCFTDAREMHSSQSRYLPTYLAQLCLRWPWLLLSDRALLSTIEGSRDAHMPYTSAFYKHPLTSYFPYHVLLHALGISAHVDRILGW
jgi:hypothetical protein